MIGIRDHDEKKASWLRHKDGPGVLSPFDCEATERRLQQTLCEASEIPSLGRARAAIQMRPNAIH